MQTRIDYSTDNPRSLPVRSPAFGANGSIPIQFTADGADIPPPIVWGPVPDGTKSIAVLVEDPDAPDRIFVHYVVVGIPPTTNAIDGELPDGAVIGKNSYGNERWNGPNPPNGRHRYFFRVFALDNAPSKPGMTKEDLMSAIKGHTLAQGELVGTYDKNGHTHDKITNEAPISRAREDVRKS
jgi:Raf kinase inhibitor-like YbhB/YbcL family protein